MFMHHWIDFYDIKPCVFFFIFATQTIAEDGRKTRRETKEREKKIWKIGRHRRVHHFLHFHTHLTHKITTIKFLRRPVDFSLRFSFVCFFFVKPYTWFKHIISFIFIMIHFTIPKPFFIFYKTKIWIRLFKYSNIGHRLIRNRLKD